MSRFIQVFSVILIFVSFSFAQSKTNEAISSQLKTLNAGKTIEVEYNSSANVTKILAFSEDFGGDQNKKSNLSAFSFGIAFNYNGKTLNAPPPVFTVTFWARGKKPVFAESHRLTVITDSGETLDLGEARYAKKSNDSTEYLNFIIARENIAKIAKSKTARLKLGNAEFTFKPEHLRLLSNMLAVSSV